MASLIGKRNIDATEGSIFSKMIYYVIPLMLTNLIQQLYTIADNLVVGRFSADTAALGAIGSSTSIVAFLTALFSGFAIGTAAIVSQDFGARDRDAIEKDLHTSVILSFAVGLAVGAVGFIFARPILELMSTKEEFIESATVYLKIRCIGMPFVSLYNIGAATLRSVGDSKSPLHALTVSGFINVLLNLLFVLVFGMAADGVALATLASQIISVVWIFLVLYKRNDEAYAFRFSSLRIDFETSRRVLRFAIPGAIQGIGGHVMNLFISSATNNIFDAELVEARTIAVNIDSVLVTVLDTYISCTLTFTGQNKGAKKPERIKKSLIYSLIQVSSIAFLCGQTMILFKEPLIRLFVNEELYNVVAITSYAGTIMTIMLTSYIAYAVCCSLCGFIRGLGHPLPTMVVALVDVFILRTVWIFLLFPTVRTIEFLYLLYPVSYVLFAMAYGTISFVLWRKFKVKNERETCGEHAETAAGKA